MRALLLAASILVFVNADARAQNRTVALTFDDIPGVAFPSDARCNGGRIREWNAKLISALKKQKVPALALVVDANMCEGERKSLSAIYSDWLDAGFEVGNHTFSHRDFNRETLEWFQDDIIRGETTFLPLLKGRGNGTKYFRYPFLRSGTELPKKRALESFLENRGYRNAPVTIDNEEYIYAQAYAKALNSGDSKLQKRIAVDYVRHMEEMIVFYEKLSKDTLGYEVPQILLVHMNALNANHLADLTSMIRKRNYRIVTIGEALKDPAYAIRDTYVGARGLSWIQRWRATKGHPLRPEPEASPWVARLAAGS